MERTVTLRSPPLTRVGKLLLPLTPGGGAIQRVLSLGWARARALALALALTLTLTQTLALTLTLTLTRT